MKSHHRSITKGIASILLVGGLAAAGVAQADPAEVQQQLFDALARGDVSAAVALFTDDAVIDTESGLCAKAPCVGKEAIRKDFERYVTDKSRKATVLKTYVSGDVLVTRFEARSATIKKSGADRIVLWGIREFKGDKISSSRCCFPERTDPQTAKFLEWDYQHPNQ